MSSGSTLEINNICMFINSRFSDVGNGVILSKVFLCLEEICKCLGSICLYNLQTHNTYFL